jgi:hypothetical protein
MSALSGANLGPVACARSQRSGSFPLEIKGFWVAHIKTVVRLSGTAR